MPMKMLTATLLISAALLSETTPAQTSAGDAGAGVEAALVSATRWLALADAGKWAESWDQMAPATQAMVSKDAWGGANGIASIRNPLGPVTSRTVQSATFTHTLPRAPAGDYVVITYNTEFARSGKGMETVVPMRTADGTWKVSGYYINPTESGAVK
jgi:hypothetical protein